MREGKKVILIDGNNLAYRAFYALPDTIVTSSGTITNAVFGFTSMLIKLLEEQKPDTIICAFDSKKPTFRHKIFDGYKANREKMPSELIGQVILIKEVLKAFNIVSLEMAGYEADDILAMLAKFTRNKFRETLIVSGDKDILQLVSEKIKVMAIKRGITDTVIYDEKKVKEKLGVTPDKIKDLLALMGDSSDNIPGIPGVGPKTARTLVKEYGSVEEIYNSINKIGNDRIRNLLSEHKDLAYMSKKLTELKSKLDINIKDAVNSSLKDIDFIKVEQLFNSLEFNTLKKRLKKIDIFSNASIKIGEFENNGNAEKTSAFRTKNKRAETVMKLDKIDLKSFTVNTNIEDLYAGGKIFIALTEENNQKRDEKREKLQGGLILSSEKGSAYLIKKCELENTKVVEKIKKLLEGFSISKSGFDFKNICKFLFDYGINLGGKIIDYKILYLLLNPLKTDTSIDEMIRDELDIEINDLETGKYNISDKEDTWDDNDERKNQLRLEFTAEDTIPEQTTPKSTTLENTISEDNKKGDFKIQKGNSYKRKIDSIVKYVSLYSELEKVLLKKIDNEKLNKLYNEIEGPLIKILAYIEYVGVNINREYLRSLIKEYEVSINRLTENIYKLCGCNFNINSPQQLSKILYSKLNLPAVKKTKTGFSTNAGALLAIFDKHPVIEKILNYREKVKLKNTYIDVLPRLINPRDNRIHTTYNQLGTSTGRISSSNPNLQNIPVRTDLGRQIRKAFIPGKNYDLLMSADYSQIELRVLAHLSGDRDLIEAFNLEEDIHKRTASEIFGVSYNEVDENLRRKAKAINFGIIYGMTEYGLKSRLSISEDEAREYIKMYFNRYPEVKKYMNTLISYTYKCGYTTTIFGRKRYIRELSSGNINIRNLGERLAVNTPIQGSAADIMKLSTIILFNELQSADIDSNIILHVHDELVLELKKDDLNRVEKIVRNSLENCMELKVGLKVDIKTGNNWYI